MKITEEFDSTLLANEDLFQDDFFKQFELSKRTVSLGEGIEKEYSFPTFYGDVTCAQAIFLCSYKAACKMMPHEKIIPVRARRTLAVLAISCYEYKNVMGIPSYNEIAFTFAVEADKEKSPVLLPLMLNNYSGYYVFSMPVTSRENCLRGNNIWGLPKVTQEIDIDTSGKDALISAYEDGVEYFQLRVPKTGKPTPMNEKTYLYSKLDDRILKAETNFKGDFFINKNMRLLLDYDLEPVKPFMKLGPSPCGEVLENLKICPVPLQLRYAEHMNACFDYYDENYKID